MKKIQIRNTSPQGLPLTATFLPEGGMNLCSYRLGKIEVIDQKTLPLFKERRAGLGALIGPHFHQREKISGGYDATLFPHIAKGKAEGRKDPFSHGIARYVPWKFVASGAQIKGQLHGTDLYKGVPLKVFEGQDFNMTFEARLLPTGLFIEYKVSSERPSLVGLHTYYTLSGPGIIHTTTQDTCRIGKEWIPLSKEWLKDGYLHFPLPQKADFGFLPKRKVSTDRDYHLILDTKNYSLHMNFNAASDEELSFQVFQPEGASYVCVEPLTAKTPQTPRLTSSTLETKLEIFSQVS